MKTIYKLLLENIMLFTALLFFSFTCNAQIAGSTAMITFTNFVQTNANTFEFDAFVVNNGITNYAMRAYAFGLNHTPGLANGGILSITYLCRDSILSVNPTPVTGYTGSQNHIRLTTTTATASGVPLLLGIAYKIARVKVKTSASSWPPNFNPFIPIAPIPPIQEIVTAGKTICLISLQTLPLPGSTFSLFGNGNTPTASTILGLAAQMIPDPLGSNPFLLNSTLFPVGTPVTACNSYTWPVSGLTYTSSGYYTQAFPIAGTCDSNAILNLTINPNTSSTLTQNACDSYTYNGQTYTATGMYSSTYMNAAGCDSTFTLNLTVNSVNNGVTQSGITLTSNSTGINYQWISCNGNILVSGATNQSFTPTANGSYAVIVSQNGCTDTSTCFTVTTIGVDDYDNSNFIQISPNPNQGVFTIELLQATSTSNISVYNTLGQLVYYSKLEIQNSEFIIDISDKSKGIYFVEVVDGENIFRKKIMKN